jgi:alkyl sulfatase BDS1-like metallo-beta-lactamase superfamily hydrolase
MQNLPTLQCTAPRDHHAAKRPFLALSFSLVALLTVGCTTDEKCDHEPHDVATDVGDGDATHGDGFDGDANTDDSDASSSPRDPVPDPATAAAQLEQHCEEQIGPPRVEQVADGLWVAIGYDLANTIVIETDDGNVIVDVGMSPERAAETRAAVEAVVPGEVAAVVLTHSHIDHVGGATVWADPETPIWATNAFTEHLVKQYGAFAPAETRRGNRQFGVAIDDETLPCSALGRRADVEAALDTGSLMPTHTFSGFAELQIGGVTIELHEAHGETHDQLYVWLPHLGALLPGDNYYAAFPNLYTIRGTSPRPVDDWIRSLDRMRAHDPEFLVPSHTRPVLGREAVRDALTAYRDAIQTVRDGVVRRANAGADIDQIVDQLDLPPELATRPDLAELYGRVDWSARAIYTSNLGWFDEASEDLLPARDAARREVALMGGPDALIGEIERAIGADDPRWAAHLIGKLRSAGNAAHPRYAELTAAVYTALGLAEANTNARGWLLRAAHELGAGEQPTGSITLNDRLVDQLPVDLVFDVMPSRLIPEAAAGVEMSVAIVFPERQFTVTIRRGVAEVFEGAPLPGSPALSATITTTEQLWKALVLGTIDPLDAIASGEFEVDDIAGALRLLELFESGV